jgi:hypothetical protein
VLEPNIKLAFSSSNIRERYCPYIVFEGELPLTILLYNSLPLPTESQYTISNCVAAVSCVDAVW